MVNLKSKRWMAKVGKRLRDSYMLYGGENMVIIPNNSDIDSYTDEGLYCVPSSSAAQTMLNYPTTTGGRLEVFNILRYTGTTAASKRLYQRLYVSGGNCDIYYRFWNGTSWYVWRKVTMTNA